MGKGRVADSPVCRAGGAGTLVQFVLGVQVTVPAQPFLQVVGHVCADMVLGAAVPHRC